MQRTIRYYYDHTKKGLVASPGHLMAALADKRASIVNVVHNVDAGLWSEALHNPMERIRARLLVGFWRSGAAVPWALFACFLIWWLPLGQRAKLEEAFWVVLGLPLIIVFLSLFGCARYLTLLRRFSRFWDKVLESSPLLSCERILPPASLLAEAESPRPKRWPAFLSVAILVLVVTVGNVAVPMPRMKALVHQLDGTTTISKTPYRLTLGDWWELVPRYVVGETYGYIYFNDDAQELVVFVVKYKVDNDKDYAANDVHQRLGNWALNLGQTFSSYAKGGMPVGLSKAGEAEYYKETFSDPQVLEAFRKQIVGALDEMLGERFVSLDVEIRVVSLSDYQAKMRKYYD